MDLFYTQSHCYQQVHMQCREIPQMSNMDSMWLHLRLLLMFGSTSGFSLSPMWTTTTRPQHNNIPVELRSTHPQQRSHDRKAGRIHVRGYLISLLLLLPSHSLLSDVDWIRLQMGSAGTEASLMETMMPCLDIEIHKPASFESKRDKVNRNSWCSE